MTLPPFQAPLLVPACGRHVAQVLEERCLGAPHVQTFLDLQAGQALCLLEGANSRPHSLHARILPG